MSNYARKNTWETASATGDKGEFEFFAAIKPYEVFAGYNRMLKEAGLNGLGYDVEKLVYKVARKESARQRRAHVDADVKGTWVSAASVREITHPDLGELVLIKPVSTMGTEPFAVDVKNHEKCMLPVGSAKRATGNLYFEDSLFASENMSRYWAHIVPRDPEYNSVDILYMPRLTELEAKKMSIRHCNRIAGVHDAGYVVPLCNVARRDDVTLIQKRRGIVDGKDGYQYTVIYDNGSGGMFGVRHEGFFVTLDQYEEWRAEWAEAARAA